MVCPCLSAEVASSSSHQVAQQPGTRRSAVETLMTLWQMLKWWTHGKKCWTLYEERMTFFATATFLLLYMFSPTVSRSAANVLSPRCEAWEGGGMARGRKKLCADIQRMSAAIQRKAGQPHSGLVRCYFSAMHQEYPEVFACFRIKWALQFFPDLLSRSF